MVAGVHLVLAAVRQQVPIGKPHIRPDQPALELIGEKGCQQRLGAALLRHPVEPAPEGVEARQAPQTKQPSGLLAAHMLELLERADVAHGHQREHHEEAPTVAEQPHQTGQPLPLAHQHQQDREDPGIAARLPTMCLGIGTLAHLGRGRLRHRWGHTQRRTEGCFDGWLGEHVRRRLRHLAVPGQRRLLAALGPLALGPAQRLERARLGAGTALVHMDVALALFVLAPARAIPVQQPMHAEFVIALAVIVQGLATELQRLGQPRLIDPVLDQLHHQDPPRGLIAQIHPFAQAAVMIHITLPARTAGKVQRITSAELEPLATIRPFVVLSKQIGLDHRAAADCALRPAPIIHIFFCARSTLLIHTRRSLRDCPIIDFLFRLRKRPRTIGSNSNSVGYAPKKFSFREVWNSALSRKMW